MLADLRALRALQHEQERALLDGDAERLAELCERGQALARSLSPAAVTDPSERAAIDDLAPEVRRAQEGLEELADRMRRSILGEIRTLGPGREALAGYRPPARDTSRLVDRAH